MADNPTPLRWRRSSRCADGFCVEVASSGGRVHVRASENPDAVLVLTREQWFGLITAITGEGLHQ